MNLSNETRTCPACGGSMRWGVPLEAVTYEHRSVFYGQPGWHCTICDEGVLEGADDHVYDSALHEVMAPAMAAPLNPAACFAPNLETIAAVQAARRGDLTVAGSPTQLLADLNEED